MHIPDRVYGIETEYGCILKKDGKTLFANEWPYEFLKHHLYRNADRRSCVVNSYGRLWHKNGSLSYIDTGQHPEHAAAEARSVRDAMIYTQAGDRIMRDLFCRAKDNGFEALLFKNNIAQDGTGSMVTFGCHENYLAYHHQHWQGYNKGLLAPFLITRQIFDGAGCWDGYGAFFLSQRARAQASLNDALGFLPVTIKSDSRSSRIHLIYGDSTLLDIAIFLKLGTTTLVISLLEAGLLPDLVCMNSPIKDLGKVSRYGAKDRTVYIHKMGAMSAYEIQVRYCEVARRELASATFDSDETAAESQLIVERWEQALNAIGSNDIAWMLGRIDWATKQWLAEGEVMRAKTKSENMFSYVAAQIRSDIDLVYHSINASCIRERIHKRWPERRLATDAEIDNAVNCPPRATRAQKRSAIIQAAIDHSMQHALAVNWHQIVLQTKQGFCNFTMENPLDTYENSVPSIQGVFLNCEPIITSPPDAASILF